MTRIQINAKRAVKDIISDLSSRSAIGDEWDNLSVDIRNEIRLEWESIVSDAIRSAIE